jgi:hypothetical protein
MKGGSIVGKVKITEFDSKTLRIALIVWVGTGEMIWVNSEIVKQATNKKGDHLLITLLVKKYD